MYAFFDKFGKKLLAVVAAMLALAFILPGTFGGGGGAGGPRLGTVDGKAVDLNEVQSAQLALQQLERVLLTQRDPDGIPRSAPLPTLIFGDALHRQLQQNPLHLYLLVHEARQAGATADERVIDRVLGSDARYVADKDRELEMGRVSQPIKDNLRDALRQVLSVPAYFQRTQAAVKISRPLVDDELARTGQQIKARVAALNADDYATKIAAPTDDELKRQFDSYKDVAPAVSDANPFGFGYRVPDRVGVQYLVVPEADVAKFVENSQPAGRWEEDAIIQYRNNPAAYQTATSQPTTKPFADARADVLKSLRQPKIADKSRQVATRIAQALDAAAANVTPPPATTGPATRQSLAGDAFSFDALQKVADAVQKQTGVRPTVVAPAGPLSLADLTRQPGFGATDGPAYVFERLRALHVGDKNDAPTGGALDLGRPTPALPGADGLYIARVTGVDPAHAADYDAVKPAVDQDVRRGKAFTLAAADAQALLDKAAAGGGLSKVAVDVQTSHWFNADDTAPGGLTGSWSGGLVGPAFEALRGVADVAALPVRTLARLRSDGRAAVIEVFEAQTSITTTTAESFRGRATYAIAQDLLPQDYIARWFAFDNVARRQAYKPDTSAVPDRKSDPRGPGGPSNPFLPG